MHVWGRIRGSFVVILDSDDVLFENFLSSHVQVHPALRNAVAFTSSNLVEIDGQGAVLIGARDGFAADSDIDRPSEARSSPVPRVSTVGNEDFDRLMATVSTTPHWHTQWV